MSMANGDGGAEVETEGAFTREQQEAAAIAFLSELNGFRDKMERLLDELPADGSDARRMITREFAIVPRPDELETIARIAADDASGGPRHELPRRLLLLRILAEREIGRLWWSNRLESEDLRATAELAPQLLVELQRVEADFRSVLASMEGLTLEDRDYLLQVADSLAIEKEPIVAAQVLGPRLQYLAEAAARGEVLEAAPTLSAEEAALFPLSVDPGAGELPARVCIDAIALKSLILEDLARWRALPADAPRARRAALAERLRMERSAHQIVAERLQQQHDAALIARLPDFAAELREVRAALYAVSLQLEAALGGPQPAPPEARPAAPTAVAAGPRRTPRVPPALWIAAAFAAGCALGALL